MRQALGGVPGLSEIQAGGAFANIGLIVSPICCVVEPVSTYPIDPSSTNTHRGAYYENQHSAGPDG